MDWDSVINLFFIKTGTADPVAKPRRAKRILSLLMSLVYVYTYLHNLTN